MDASVEQDVFEPIVRGINQSGVRLANERAVLTLIAGIPGVSNADIARRSRLGPQTTARILLDLEERDLIIRGEVLRGRRGQPATPYRLNPEGAFSIGVTIGWDHADVLLQTIAGKPVAATRRSFAFPDPATVFAEIGNDVRTMLAALTPEQRPRLAGIGVTSPGRFGTLLQHLGASDAGIAQWAETDIAARLETETGLAVQWVNDGSAAAWRELTALPPPRPQGIAAFFVGTFVGGGIASGGTLLEGPYGNAGDLGGIIVHDRAGRPEYLHLLASQHALELKLRRAGRSMPASGGGTWADIEPQLSEWIDDAGHALAQAVISTTAMAEIDLAVINGNLPKPVLERILAATAQHLDELPWLLARRPKLAAGQAGPAAAAIGAAQLLLFRRYFSRAWELFEA
jgi:predicted NBD/HSP70 family sugar kinase